MYRPTIRNCQELFDHVLNLMREDQNPVRTIVQLTEDCSSPTSVALIEAYLRLKLKDCGAYLTIQHVGYLFDGTLEIGFKPRPITELI